MITKKLWNSFSRNTKIEILKIYYGESFNMIPNKYKTLLEPYKHDFEFNAIGKTLKSILSTCYLQKDGSIDVTVNLSPSYAPISTSISSIKRSTPTIISEESVYYVDYEDKSGDLCHVWTRAFSSQEAREKIEDEYWDIKEIISIHKN